MSARASTDVLRWDKETGLLVFGAGAGGMTAALVGKLEGLDVLLCEKTEVVGGVTAASAGTAWVPGISQSRRAGVADSVEQARAYLDSVIGARGGDAARGVGSAFGRGEGDLNRINGDPGNKPNPCVRPVGPGPFYAVAVRPADLASSAGLAGDGRVLDAAGEPMPGLYACGNDMASVFRGTYPGPGTLIGPALVLGWRAARHASGLADPAFPAPQDERA